MPTLLLIMVGALAMKERCSGIVLSMKIKFLQTV
jgi:hypothetical protein